jgi:GT2 family glycosyltransferase
MKKVSVLIPIHNCIEYTKKCLHELTGLLTSGVYSNCEFSIIVIDDGSSDGSKEWISNNYPGITVLEGDGNLWWTGAINKGAKYAFEEAGSDYVLLWNNDIKAHSNYFLKLSEILSREPDITIIGSKIYNLFNNRVWSFGGIFNPKTGKKYMIGLNRTDSDEFNKVIEVDWLTGMGTVVSKKAVEQTGYWDRQNFPQYHGDSDFTYRAKLQGFKLKVFPELLLYNDTSVTGYSHQYNLKRLLVSFANVKSKLNVSKNIRFYRKYAKSPLAYFSLIVLYFKVIGGFIKWNTLKLIGIKKK